MISLPLATCSSPCLLMMSVPEAWQSLRDGYMDALYRVGNVIGADGKTIPPSQIAEIRPKE